MSRRKIGITGGGGYVGGSLAKRMSEAYDVKLLDIKEPNSIPGDSVFQPCDVTDYRSVAECVSDVDLVIHTAIIQIPEITEKRALGYEVNVLGTQNVCKAVEESARTKGMILSSSWHTIGEHGVRGKIDESFGYRPDKVEPRATLYVLSKIAQESIFRFYDESFDKTYGIIRMGTVLGQNMPATTAANIFIGKALTGQPLTPFKHSMYRPMFFVDIDDVTEAYLAFARGILNDEIPRSSDSFSHIVNFFLPQPITVLDLARTVANSVRKISGQTLNPRIEVVDKGQASLFTIEDKERAHGDVQKSKELLHVAPTTSVRESIDKIVRARLSHA
jgi:nucleoside-diphosphate-sugar epimerase